MDKYMKLMCIKGLIMSMDEQINMYFEKDNLPLNLKEKITNQYYDAINEQLDQPKTKEDCPLLFEFNIIVNGKRHIIHTKKDKTIDWQNIVLLSELAKTGNEILNITFAYNEKDVGESEGLLEVSESIKVTEGMIFNVATTP